MKRIIMMVLRNILLVPWMWAKIMLSCIPRRQIHGRGTLPDAAIHHTPREQRRQCEDRCTRTGKYPEGEWIYVLPKSSGIIRCAGAGRCVSEAIFRSCEKRSGKCAIFKTGVQVYESIHDGPRRHPSVLQVIVNVTNEVKKGRKLSDLPGREQDLR